MAFVTVFIRPYTRRKPRHVALARSTLVTGKPGETGKTGDIWGHYGKRKIVARSPSGKKFTVMATVLGGGGASQAPIVEGAELNISKSAWNEAAADTMDDVFGFDVVPPTYLHLTDEMFKGKPVVASAQEWKEGTVSLYQIRQIMLGEGDDDDPEPGDVTEPNKEDLMKIVLFDLIIGNVDRHDGNIIVAQRSGRAYAIDNENAFTTPWRSTSLRAVATSHSAMNTVAGMPIPSNIRKKIASVEEGDFRAAMAGIEKEAIDKAWLRKKYVETLTVMPTKADVEAYSYSNDL